MHEIECEVRGTVQGVAYRVYVQDSATELGLCGLVKNMPDGSVYVCAQGERDTLKDFIEYLHEGSLLSHVESVAVSWNSATHIYDDFGISH